MRDDDYIPSWYASPRFNVRDALANGGCKQTPHKRRTVIEQPQFRGGVNLRDVWEGYRDAPIWNKPSRTPLEWILRLGGFACNEIAKESGMSHTTVMRLAREYGVPHKRPDCWRLAIAYMNSELIRKGFAPVRAAEVFPYVPGCNTVSEKTWRRSMKEIGI